MQRKERKGTTAFCFTRTQQYLAQFKPLALEQSSALLLEAEDVSVATGSPNPQIFSFPPLSVSLHS
jgi:hypothetical protein